MVHKIVYLTYKNWCTVYEPKQKNKTSRPSNPTYPRPTLNVLRLAK